MGFVVFFFLLYWTSFNTFLGKWIAELFNLRSSIGEIKQDSVIAHRKEQLNESPWHELLHSVRNAAYLYDSLLICQRNDGFTFISWIWFLLSTKSLKKESRCALSKRFLFKYHLSSEIIWINLLFACPLWIWQCSADHIAPTNIGYSVHYLLFCAIPFHLICSALKELDEL